MATKVETNRADGTWCKPKYFNNRQSAPKGLNKMKTISMEEFTNKINKVHNINSDDYELLSPYEGYNKPIIFKCNHCGCVKTVLDNSLTTTKKNKNICRCYGYTEEWHRINKKYKDWLNTQEDYNIIDEYKGNKINLLVECKKCHSKQKRSINSLINNDGCLICELKHSALKTTEQFQKELNLLYNDEYFVEEQYKGVLNDIRIKHLKCNTSYLAKPHYILTKKGGKCPVCYYNKSKGEQKIQYILDKYKVNYSMQKRFDDLKKMPFDFFIEDYNLAIEFQGIQHFQPIEFFGGVDSFKNQLKIDTKKLQYCIDNDYNYLSIPYYHFNNIESILVQRLSLAKE